MSTQKIGGNPYYTTVEVLATNIIIKIDIHTPNFNMLVLFVGDNVSPRYGMAANYTVKQCLTIMIEARSGLVH